MPSKSQLAVRGQVAEHGLEVTPRERVVDRAHDLDLVRHAGRVAVVLGARTPRSVTERGRREQHAGQTPRPMIRTSLVGSYAQPDWLIDREKLRGRFPPRVRARELWRVDPAYLEEAQDDATRLAIADQERAGLDIITDGEMRRESYSNRFATALEGVDIDNPGTALDRSGHPNPVPRVVGPIARKHPVQVRDLEFLRAHTSPHGEDHRARAVHDVPAGAERLLRRRRPSSALAYADAVREEILDLFAAGADIVQVDEPYMQARPEPARAYGLAALKRATDGLPGTTAVHICFGYAAIIHERPSGYSFLPELAATECDQISIETAQSGLDLDVLDALLGQDDHPRRARPLDRRGRDARDRGGPDPARVPAHGPERLIAAPDCGMKYLPRASAYGKLEALVEGARLASGY